MICSKCGCHNETDNAKFCHRCGAPLAETPSVACKTCGKALPHPEMSFCPYCGSPTKDEPVIMVCPECAREYVEDFLYCEDCGRRLQPKQRQVKPQPKVNVEQPRKGLLDIPMEPHRESPRERVVHMPQGLIQETLNSISYYPGIFGISPKNMLGNLTITADRLSFKTTFGGALSGGLLASGKIYTFEMSQIRSVQPGKCAGVFPAIFLELKNGEKHTFATSIPGSSASIERAIHTINRCIRQQE